ncbi:MAG TPA: hypothetical protein VG123_05705 [Streptosporangiaceae bacterium]|nr:hypothetical protein [Streptosporangiaceae bacterium]
MPKLTSQRDSPDVTGLNAAPRITGIASAPRADVLPAGSRPDTGRDMRNFGAQLNPASTRLGHRRGLEQRYAICQYRREIAAATSADLTWIVAAGQDDFDHDASPRNTRLRESRTAATH